MFTKLSSIFLTFSIAITLLPSKLGSTPIQEDLVIQTTKNQNEVHLSNYYSSLSEQNTEEKKDKNIENISFEETGRPGDRVPGESRTGNITKCPSTSFPLTAIVPQSKGGKTLAQHPKFWFYFPYNSQQVTKIEFSLQDKDRNDIFRKELPIPHTPQYLSISIPNTINGLKTNLFDPYLWYFKINCDKDASKPPLFVYGWIDRVSLGESLKQELKQKKDKEYFIYAKHKIWFEAIDVILTMYSSNTANPKLRRDWQKIINSPGVNLNLPDL